MKRLLTILCLLLCSTLALSQAADRKGYPGCVSDGKSGINCTGAMSSPTAPLNLMAYGAVADERDLYDGVVTAGSPTLTSATGAFSSSDNGKVFTVMMGAQGIVKGSFTSGITPTGAAKTYCILAFNTGGGAGATGKVYLTGTNTIAGGAVIYMDNYGTGYTSAPTTATPTNGTATGCDTGGPIVLTTTLATFAVKTTGTVVNSTTVTLGTNATTSGTGVRVSITTDNATALQNCVNAAQAAHKQCFIPSGRFGKTGTLVISDAMTLIGEGVYPNYGVSTATGWDDVTPNFAPYLFGSVLVQMESGIDAIQITGSGSGYNLEHFGVVFAPPLAMLSTGHGVNATPTALNGGNLVAGIANSVWSDVSIWGHDGNHYAFQVTNGYYIDMFALRGWGGGGLNLVEALGSPCCTASNIKVYGSYFQTAVGNSASGYSFINNSTAGMGITSLFHPQSNIYPLSYLNASNPLAAWPLPPPNPYAQCSFAAAKNSTGEFNNYIFLMTDFEQMHNPQVTCGSAAISGRPTYFAVDHNGMMAASISNSRYLQFLNAAGTGTAGFISSRSDNSVQIETNANSTPVVILGSFVKTNRLVPNVVYSAAGTALPTCDSTTNTQTAVVSDATAPTYMGAYTSGGAVVAQVICSYNGSAYGWKTK